MWDNKLKLDLPSEHFEQIPGKPLNQETTLYLGLGNNF